MSDAVIALNWQQMTWVAGIVIAWTGFLVGIIRVLISKMVSSLEKRMDSQTNHWEKAERDLHRLMSELPTQYQRRDDFLRELEQAESRYQKAVEQVIAILREKVTDSERRIHALQTAIDGYEREFQRRDDAIREYTAINAKIDRLTEVLIDIKGYLNGKAN
ncbi:MAG: hypothetical protein IPI97_08160 [Nitrosomonas sp.]|nr:hypothetical protein [Nitrosomonas sp.]MBK7364961.1 hypothetical protein [Nitrosomonas sp.]